MTELHDAFWTHYRISLPMDKPTASQLTALFQAGDLANALGDVQLLSASSSLAPVEEVEADVFFHFMTVKQPFHTDFYGFERSHLATPKQGQIALLANGSIVESWLNPEHFLDWLRGS